MKSRRTYASLHPYRLEDRLTPAGTVSLISQSDPSLYSDSASGASLVGWNPENSQPLANVVSDNGQYVVYLSLASDLLPNQADENNGYDVFLYDRLSGTTELVSHKAGSLQASGNGVCFFPTISADGRYVAFQSTSSDLIAGMTMPVGSSNNIFVYDRLNKSSNLVSHAATSSLTGSSWDAIGPSISADGSVITFTSAATNLTSGFPNPGGSISTGFTHAYLYSSSTGQVTLIDRAVGSSTNPGNNNAFGPMVSPDGRYVSLLSKSTNLLVTATTNKINVFRYDRLTDQLIIVSNNSGGSPLGGNGDSVQQRMSNDGRWITFGSNATNLVSGATVSGRQVYLYDVQTDTTVIVSHAAAAPLSGGNNSSTSPRLSADGRYIAFLSQANNLVSAYSSGHSTTTSDVYLYDRLTDQVALVNHQVDVTTAGDNGGTIMPPVLSLDGRYVTFVSLGTDLVSAFIDNNDPNTIRLSYDLYRYDRDTGVVSLLSGQNGSVISGGNGNSPYAAASVDGNVVAWTSLATNLITPSIDANSREDVFVRDVLSNSTQLASRRLGPPSLSAGGKSDNVRQSADGRFVVFNSSAPNVIANQTRPSEIIPGQIFAPQSYNVFLHDRLTGSSVLVSHAFGNPTAEANGQCWGFQISADGRYVTYMSVATNLLDGFVDNNGSSGIDVYLYDRLTGTNILVSRQAGNAETGGNQTSYLNGDYQLSISADGQLVGFVSRASNLVAGFSGTLASNVFVFDRMTGSTSLVSHEAANPSVGGENNSLQPHLSADGRYVAYWSTGSNMVAGMTGGGGRNVFLYDRQTQTTVLVSHAAVSQTASGNGGSNNPAISPDGRFIVYQSASNNLITGQTDTNNGDDVFLYDRDTGTNVLVSHAYDSQTTAGNYLSRHYHTRLDARIISADGRFIVYESGSTNLIPGFVDTNGLDPNNLTAIDIFLYDRLNGTNTLITHAHNSAVAGGNGGSTNFEMSSDGRWIAISSDATNLAPDWVVPATNHSQIVIYDRINDSFSLASHTPVGQKVAANGESGLPTVSANGEVVSFISRATDLTPSDRNGFEDVFSYTASPPTVTSVVFGDGTNQRSLVKRIVVAFSEPVSFTGGVASAFTLTRTGPGGTTGNVELTADPTSGPTSTVTITFSGSLTEFGSLVDGVYDFIISAAQVFSVGGALDGNNDGMAGGSYVVIGSSSNSFYRLFGDANGDRMVNLTDFAALRSVMMQPSSIFDFDDKGYVHLSDFVQLRKRFGMVVA